MAVASRVELHARPVADRDEIAAFLHRDRLHAAYALAELDGPGRRRASWGMAYDHTGQAVAAGMHHEGLIPRPLFLMGDPEGCQAILLTTLKPRDAFFQLDAEQTPAVAELYDLDTPIEVLRMAVDGESFRPFAGPAERLTSRDVDDLNRLYKLGFRTAFPNSVIEEGVYYGVRVGGRLIAAAGTHGISRREGIGIVGNVMTHADFRGHNFAKMVTSAVTAELLSEVRDVALNVHADNESAVAAYTRLGYRIHCRLVERLGRRRSSGSWLIRPFREAMRRSWPRDPG